MTPTTGRNVSDLGETVQPRHRQPWIRSAAAIAIIGVLFLLAVWSPDAVSQKRTRDAVPRQVKEDSVQSARRKTLTLRYGVGIPLSDKAITQFWAPGQTISAEFLINITPHFYLGLGLDVAKYPFRERWFALAYPAIPPQSTDLYWWNLYFSSKRTFSTGTRFVPFAFGQVGVSRVTDAEYREVIAGVRVIYYDIKGSTRLTLGFGGGVDYYIYRWLLLQAEVKMTYAHNDPQRSLIPLLRGGVIVVL